MCVCVQGVDSQACQGDRDGSLKPQGEPERRRFGLAAKSDGLVRWHRRTLYSGCIALYTMSIAADVSKLWTTVKPDDNALQMLQLLVNGCRPAAETLRMDVHLVSSFLHGQRREKNPSQLQIQLSSRDRTSRSSIGA